MVDPPAKPSNRPAPFTRITQHNVTTSLVEGHDADVFDLARIIQPQLLLGLVLHGQPVAVPTPTALNGIALHGPKPRHHVLEHTRHQMPIVRQSRGKGWPVIERKRRSIRLLGHGGLKSLVLIPTIKTLPLLVGERHRGSDGFHAHSCSSARPFALVLPQFCALLRRQIRPARSRGSGP